MELSLTLCAEGTRLRGNYHVFSRIQKYADPALEVVSGSSEVKEALASTSDASSLIS